MCECPRLQEASFSSVYMEMEAGAFSLVPFNSSGEERATRIMAAAPDQLQAPDVLHRSTVHHGIHVPPEPETEESTTIVEDLLCGTK